MTSTDSAPVARRWTLPRPDRQSGLVLAMTVAFEALAVLVGLPFLSTPVIAEALRLPWWLLAIGFAATEACVLHIQLKREAQTVSISELPLVLACSSPPRSVCWWGAWSARPRSCSSTDARRG